MKSPIRLFPCFLFAGLAAFALELMTDPKVEAHLATARENVRLAEATERRIAAQLEALLAQPGVDSNVVATTTRYREEVRALAATHRQTLADLEAIAFQENPANDPVVAKGLAELGALLDAQPIPESAEDPIAKLDAEFEASLSGFDTVLLERMSALQSLMDTRAAEGASTAGEQARAAADAAALLRGMGVDPGVPTAAPPAGAPAVEGATAGTAAQPPPPRDEDIVARQLREAAERETDPVLRENLWKEYEAYVGGRS